MNLSNQPILGTYHPLSSIFSIFLTPPPLSAIWVVWGILPIADKRGRGASPFVSNRLNYVPPSVADNTWTLIELIEQPQIENVSPDGWLGKLTPKLFFKDLLRNDERTKRKKEKKTKRQKDKKTKRQRDKMTKRQKDKKNKKTKRQKDKKTKRLKD